MLELAPAIEKIRALWRQPRSHGCPLVAISGIDGSGKGYVSALIERALVSEGIRVAVINIDGWLNCPRLPECRSGEGLSPDATIGAYRDDLFPGTDAAFRTRQSKSAASSVIVNDPLIAGVVRSG